MGSVSSGTTDTESGARALRSVLAGPWARRAWRDLGFTVLSAGLNLLPLLVMALPWTFYVPISLLAVLTCMFVSVGAAVALCPWLTVLRRACFYELLGVRIPRPPTIERSPDSSGGVWSALRDRLRSPRTWRQACYHLVVGPAVNLLGLLGGLLWVAALIGLATSAVLALLTAVGVFRYAGQRVWDGAELWIVLLWRDPGVSGPVDRLGRGADGHPGGLRPARPEPGGEAGPAGGEADREPGRRGRRGRRRAPPDRARPARWRTAAAGLAGDEPRPGPGDPGGRAVRAGPTGFAGSARGGQGGADRATGAGARTAPGGARRPRPRRGAVRDRRPLPGAGAADCGRAAPGLADGGGRRRTSSSPRPWPT